MDKVVHNLIPLEELERLKRLQDELEGQELTYLIERIQKQFELSVNQVAVAAGMDESALHKILKGENREFKAEHVDALLDYLEQQGKLNNVYELAVWKRALRVSAYLHFDIYKSIEPRLRKIKNTVKRVEALKAYLREQYPALAETYDNTGGTFPVFVPLFDTVARELNRRFIKPKSSQLKVSHSLEAEIMKVDDIEFVRVPAGKFLMGSDRSDSFEWEKPQHIVDINYDYWIARYPVTNQQYNVYVEASGINHPVFDWKKKKNHPVVCVSWKNAMKYCHWLDNLQKYRFPPGLIFRLPTEAEWEKAARGESGNEWPWGDQFDKNRCNTSEGGKGGTTPVGLYSPQGDSPYGCTDMAGNVEEWTHSQKKNYPYKFDDGREDYFVAGTNVIRGGNFANTGYIARCAFRVGGYHFDLVGFRVVLAPFYPSMTLANFYYHHGK